MAYLVAAAKVLPMLGFLPQPVTWSSKNGFFSFLLYPCLAKHPLVKPAPLAVTPSLNILTGLVPKGSTEDLIMKLSPEFGISVCVVTRGGRCFHEVGIWQKEEVIIRGTDVYSPERGGPQNSDSVLRWTAAH